MARVDARDDARPRDRSILGRCTGGLPGQCAGYSVQSGPMTRPFFTGTLLACLLFQLIHVVPAHAIAALRAVACCAHCDHARSPADAMRCCGIQLNDEVATVSKVTAPAVAHVGVVVASTVRDSSAPHPADTTRRERASPLFLLVRSLRL
jgi:hypothetical protein